MNKGFKETEIGMIPRDWDMDALSSVCLKPCQWNPNKELRTDFTYIDVSAVSNETCKVAYPTHVDAKNAPSRARKIINAGDVIYATVRPELRRIAFIEKEYDNQIASTAFCVVRADASKSNGKYLYYSLRTEKINRMIAEFQRGASYPAVTDKDILRQQIPLPPLPEQKKIAAVLAKLQKAIEIQDNILSSLRDLKKSMMHRLFSYGLKGEKRKKTEIGLIPEGWEATSISDVFDIQQGKSLSAKNQTGEFKKPFLRTSNVYWGHLDLSTIDEMDFSMDEREKLKFNYGDVLVCEGGEIGRTAIWRSELAECYYQNHVFRLRTRDDNTNPFFFMYWMQAGHLILKVYTGAGNKTTIPNLSRSRLSQFLFPLPPLPEQTEIAHILQTIDRKIEVHEGKKSSQQDLFKTMLNNLMTGTIRVNELDIDTAEVEAA